MNYNLAYKNLSLRTLSLLLSSNSRPGFPPTISPSSPTCNPPASLDFSTSFKSSTSTSAIVRHHPPPAVIPCFFIPLSPPSFLFFSYHPSVLFLVCYCCVSLFALSLYLLVTDTLLPLALFGKSHFLCFLSTISLTLLSKYYVQILFFEVSYVPLKTNLMRIHFILNIIYNVISCLLIFCAIYTLFAAKLDLDVWLADAKQAYLGTWLPADHPPVYIHPPKCARRTPDETWQSLVAIYGMEIAGRLFYLR